MVLECDSVWKTRLAVFYRGVMQGPAQGWEGKAAGHVFHVQEHSSLSLSVQGFFSKSLQDFLLSLSDGVYPLFPTLPLMCSSWKLDL